MRRSVSAAVLAGLCVCCGLAVVDRATAEIVVAVNKSKQRMAIVVDGAQRHVWSVSTGTAGGPPSGTYRPERMERKWFSRKYNMSPMPYSIFFHEGYAIHGTIYVSRLGNRASHGCVRLHPANAAVLFDLVRNHGMGRTTIVVSHSDYVPKPLGLRPAVSTTGEPAETTAAIPGAPAAFGRDTEHAPDHTGEAVPQPADGEPHAADGEE